MFIDSDNDFQLVRVTRHFANDIISHYGTCVAPEGIVDNGVVLRHPVKAGTIACTIGDAIPGFWDYMEKERLNVSKNKHLVMVEYRNAPLLALYNLKKFKAIHDGNNYVIRAAKVAYKGVPVTLNEPGRLIREIHEAHHGHSTDVLVNHIRKSNYFREVGFRATAELCVFGNLLGVFPGFAPVHATRSVKDGQVTIRLACYVTKRARTHIHDLFDQMIDDVINYRIRLGLRDDVIQHRTHTYVMRPEEISRYIPTLNITLKTTELEFSFPEINEGSHMAIITDSLVKFGQRYIN